MATSDMSYNAYIERVRRKQYPSLLKTTYLDHAGTTLYATAVIDAVHKDLNANMYGNPHSESPASWLSTNRVEETRQAVLSFFNADPGHFDVVFAANATAAMKIVADCFREEEFWYGYHKDAHSSLVGIRELAKLGSRCFTSNESVEEWLRSSTVPQTTLKLFGYPAQSNMTGYRPPYSWCRDVRLAHPNTYVLLDAASYLTSGRLDLRDVDAAPDFTCLSFYKIIGYPDLGALIVKKSAFNVMARKRYFGGGTVDLVTAVDDAFRQVKRNTMHDFLEDGTLPFHNIVALSHAISIHPKIFGTRDKISKHTADISAWLFKALMNLKHRNSLPVIELYQDKNATYGDAVTQGPILSFNVLRSNGTYVGKSHVERLAIACGFQLRTGGVCNPGGIASMLQLRSWELRRNFAEGVRCGDKIDIVATKPTGIVRISLGPMSTLSDAIRFMDFMAIHFVDTADHMSHEMRTTIAKIIPIEGCSPISISSDAAYEVWHHQWCIVDSLTGQRISAGLADLQVEIDVLSEELVIDESIRLSLWDQPEIPKNGQFSTMDRRLFDFYENKTANDRLSSIVGCGCKLARFRPEDPLLSEEALTCVVASCLLRCKSEEDVRKHYEVHAGKFLCKSPHEAEQRLASKSWRNKFVAWKTSQAVRDSRKSGTPVWTVSALQIPSSKNLVSTKTYEIRQRSSGNSDTK